MALNDYNLKQFNTTGLVIDGFCYETLKLMSHKRKTVYFTLHMTNESWKRNIQVFECKTKKIYKYILNVTINTKY